MDTNGWQTTTKKKYEMKNKCNSKCSECLIQPNVDGNNIEKQSNICLRASYLVLFRFTSNEFLRRIEKQKAKSWVSMILFTFTRFRDIVWWEIPGALVILIIIGKYSNNNNLFVQKKSEPVSIIQSIIKITHLCSVNTNILNENELCILHLLN